MRVDNASVSVNTLGQVSIFGEVLNGGDVYVNSLQVDVRLMDNQDPSEVLAIETVNFTTPFGSERSSSLTIPPGGKVGFTATFEDRTLSSKMSTYDFAARYDIADAKPRTINITDSHIYAAGSGNGVTNWVILGELKNDGEYDIWNVYTIIAVHDTSDRVIAVSQLRGPFTQESPLEAGESWAYFTNVHLPSDPTAMYVQVHAESEQSVIVPEFPIAPLVLAVSGSIPLLIVTLQRIRSSSAYV